MCKNIMERNVLKMIDVTQYMLFESSGDSDVKSDLNTPCGRSFSTFDCWFYGKFDREDHHKDNNDGGGNNDDAESCSYDSSYGECVDEFCGDYQDHKGFVNKHDGNDYYYDNCNRFRRSEYEEDDEMEEDEDAIDSKLMVEEELLEKKNGLCTDFIMGRRQKKRSRSKDYCSSMEFLNNQKETDKNFWDTCLAS